MNYIIKTDLKGSIPTRIASKVALEQPYTIHRVGEALRKDRGFFKASDVKKPLKKMVFSSAPLTSAVTKVVAKSEQKNDLRAVVKHKTHYDKMERLKPQDTHYLCVFLKRVRFFLLSTWLCGIKSIIPS